MEKRKGEYAEVEAHLGRLKQQLADSAQEMTGAVQEQLATAEDAAAADDAAPETPRATKTAAAAKAPGAAAANTQAASAAASPAAVSSPNNAAEFWRHFERVLDSAERTAALLLSVPPSRLRGYLSNQLEPDHAAAVVPALSHMARNGAGEGSSAATAAAEAYKRLRALTRTPRLDIALGLLDDAVLASVAASADQVCDAVLQHVGDKVKPDEVAQVRQRFHTGGL